MCMHIHIHIRVLGKLRVLLHAWYCGICAYVHVCSCISCEHGLKARIRMFKYPHTQICMNAHICSCISYERGTQAHIHIPTYTGFFYDTWLTYVADVYGMRICIYGMHIYAYMCTWLTCMVYILQSFSPGGDVFSVVCAGNSLISSSDDIITVCMYVCVCV
jgi:hypothetical protein